MDTSFLDFDISIQDYGLKKTPADTSFLDFYISIQYYGLKKTPADLLMGGFSNAVFGWARV